MDWWTDCSQGLGGLQMGLGIADKAVALGGLGRSRCLCRVFELGRPWRGVWVTR